jgi:hypothetical protein
MENTRNDGSVLVGGKFLENAHCEDREGYGRIILRWISGR